MTVPTLIPDRNSVDSLGRTPTLPSAAAVGRGRDRAAVAICLLGSFRIVHNGRPIAVRSGGKAEQLLSSLGLRVAEGIAREELLQSLWPESDSDLATQSLNTLVYSLRRSLGTALGGRAPVVRRDGRYRLNTEGGVSVDIIEFDMATEIGDRLARTGDRDGAIRRYDGAVKLYAGDLVVNSEVRHLLERERLRARYLSVRAKLADHHFAAGRFAMALVDALDVLAHDPCREDAHRMAMRCYVRLGERAQALRQYQLCCELLAHEFDAPPEATTRSLFEAVRLTPESV